MKGKASKIPYNTERYMARALILARRGLGKTEPNPMVGAVIVKSGVIVGEGYHHAAGKPHAEIEAIRSAGNEAQGADMFVTLEPCNHHGRTPPCTHAIIRSGLKSVSFGMKDPNPSVEGGGAEFLRSQGVEVFGPVLESRCQRLNEVFITNVALHRPFVYLKLAMSLDGKIATRTGQSKWITCEASRKRAHQLRNQVSAVMVGIGTVVADDPSLTTRLPNRKGRDPIRVIVDSSLRTPHKAKIFQQDSEADTIIACRKEPPPDKSARLIRAGATIVRTKDSERVDLNDLMSQLYESGITSILLEGGATLAWSALHARIVDRCLFFYAPMVIGGKDAPPGVGGMGVENLIDAVRLSDIEIKRIDQDLLVTGRVL
jgi:diaminohydroxyphosphoribosylaminopyrimidine deaminase/5-amino-6-(5-phosphoribosylamino)uracil reductase